MREETLKNSNTHNVVCFCQTMIVHVGRTYVSIRDCWVSRFHCHSASVYSLIENSWAVDTCNTRNKWDYAIEFVSKVALLSLARLLRLTVSKKDDSSEISLWITLSNNNLCSEVQPASLRTIWIGESMWQSECWQQEPWMEQITGVLMQLPERIWHTQRDWMLLEFHVKFEIDEPTSHDGTHEFHTSS